MTRHETIVALRRQADAVRAIGATAMYLFGSAGRGEPAPDSDVDLFVDYDPAGRFSLVELVGQTTPRTPPGRHR